MNWEELNNRRERHAAKYSVVFKRALYRQFKPVIEAIREIKDPDQLKNVVGALVKPEPIKDALIKLYTELLRSESKRLSSRIKKGENFWAERATSFVNTKGAKRVATITKTSQDLAENLINNEIVNGLNLGLPAAKVAKNIEKAVPEFLKTQGFRAMRIARTETGTATTTAAYEVAKETGEKYNKVWMTAPGGISKVERHNQIPDLDGQTVGMDEYFNVDGELLLYPLDTSGSAANVVNCKCDYYFEPIEEMI